MHVHICMYIYIYIYVCNSKLNNQQQTMKIISTQQHVLRKAPRREASLERRRRLGAQGPDGGGY